ncbi:MAG: hypothetical protein NTX55_02905 [Candidatus Parcubacteria bacterium]|nr:hypothetical protein [Candidatus Parcubacteria bacterium]
MLAKIKNFFKFYEKDLILAAVIILVALISFGLGRLSKIGESRVPITIENLTGAVQQGESLDSIQGLPLEKTFVASKNGTKYHYPWCSGAQSIKEENKIWFSTAEEAQKAGYSPASNCKGLK